MCYENVSIDPCVGRERTVKRLHGGDTRLTPFTVKFGNTTDATMRLWCTDDATGERWLECIGGADPLAGWRGPNPTAANGVNAGATTTPPLLYLPTAHGSEAPTGTRWCEQPTILYSTIDYWNTWLYYKSIIIYIIILL